MSKEPHKTMNSVMRQFYKQKMERLLNRHFVREINGKRALIGFSRYGNRHLYSDSTGRSRHLQRSDLPNMDKVFGGAEYVQTSELYKNRKDNIVKFHYFKTKLHGSIVYINVGEQEYETNRPGRVGEKRVRYIVYSVTDRLQQKKKPRR